MHEYLGLYKFHEGSIEFWLWEIHIFIDAQATSLGCKMLQWNSSIYVTCQHFHAACVSLGKLEFIVVGERHVPAGSGDQSPSYHPTQGISFVELVPVNYKTESLLKWAMFAFRSCHCPIFINFCIWPGLIWKSSTALWTVKCKQDWKLKYANLKWHANLLA